LVTELTTFLKIIVTTYFLDKCLHNFYNFILCNLIIL